ncbi:MAG: methionine--tRNA ligase, partial [Actinomycetota bacterium]|nr:methionine--tRNA ligase [Actinomycetota bacterium]
IDFFIRTTDEGHKEFVQEFLRRIYDNGDVYQDVYAGLYCVGCEAFKTEADLVDGKCPDHGVAPEWLEEKNWFFRLSAYEDKLLELYERPDFVLPAFRANEAKGFIAGGLRDFSISRATQTWGIPIPWDPDQVAYVWADALINYLSALSYAPGVDLGLWPGRHLLGKDILRFHCVYWPAMLLSAGYEPPQQLFVHGYLNIDDKKISKSLGNAVDPFELIDRFGVDPVRFWVARIVPFGQDGDVTIESFTERYDRELANDLGNLLSRTTAMIARYRDGEVRAVPDDKGDLAAAATKVHDEVPAALDRWDVTGALETIWDYVRGLNRYVEQTKPWELAKDADRSDELDRALYELADGLRVAAVALSAYLPETSVRILEALGQPLDVAWGNVAYAGLVPVTGIEASAPLFPRIDEPVTAP